jgi:HEAT repeat protein
MTASQKRIAIALLCLSGGVGILWAAIALPPWIREERVLARLKTKDRQEQIKVVEALAEMGSVRAIPRILEVMWQRKPEGSDHVNFREALKSIIEKRGRDAVSPLVRELKSPDLYVRKTACELLGDLGTEAGNAIPSLAELLEDRDPSLRLQVAKALYEVGANENHYVPALDKLSAEQDHSLRAQVLTERSRITPTEKRPLLIPGLIEALNDNSSGIIGQCILDLLKEFGPAASEAIPSVLEKATASKVRLAALDCLGSMGADRQEVQDLLLKTLGDPQSGIRAAAARVLSSMGTHATPALPTLKELLESDPDKEVRISAACAVLHLEPNNKLAESTVRTARDALVDRFVRSELRSGRNLGWNPNQAPLLSMGIEDSQLGLFIEALKDPDPTCRSKALFFLGTLGPAAKPALSAIIEAARDPDLRVRAQAARTLGAIGPAAAEAIFVLNESLRARNAAVRDNARRALRQIKGP